MLGATDGLPRRINDLPRGVWKWYHKVLRHRHSQIKPIQSKRTGCTRVDLERHILTGKIRTNQHSLTNDTRRQSGILVADDEALIERSHYMADTDLTQAQADALIALEKHRANEDRHTFPMGGQALTLPLQSPDNREQFILDISRGRIDLSKVKMQNRARQVVILVRIDLAGAPHRNPNGEEVPCPHLHRYREGFGDKWAQPLPPSSFPESNNVWATLGSFYSYCRISRPPHVERGLFT